MEMTDQPNLLAEYVAKGSEEAFRELVTRYLSLVYSTAIRLANGDPCLAEDVTQTVFANLARLAATLSPGVMLGGWLHRRTWHVASATMRSERRRQHRERQAAEMNASQDSSDATFDQIAPVLDEAVNQLGEEDRAAITLRFLAGRDFQSVGEAPGGNAEAARKPVDRALEKLREQLMRRGVSASGTTLAIVLAAHALIAPPAGMAAIVSSAALASAAGSSGLTLTLLKVMATSTLKIAVSTVSQAAR
jgi:RNA polymerase sigma factor (sigma-70 family)